MKSKENDPNKTKKIQCKQINSINNFQTIAKRKMLSTMKMTGTIPPFDWHVCIKLWNAGIFINKNFRMQWQHPIPNQIKRFNNHFQILCWNWYHTTLLSSYANECSNEKSICPFLCDVRNGPRRGQYGTSKAFGNASHRHAHRSIILKLDTRKGKNNFIDLQQTFNIIYCF